jgi:hypothetical protein
MPDEAVLGGTLALALFTYVALIAGDKWNRSHDDAIRYGVWRGVKLSAKERRKLFYNGYAAWAGGTASIQAIAALSFLGIGRSVDSQFPSVVAYICAYVFLIATFSTVVMGALASAELWQAMREADENEASGADPT